MSKACITSIKAESCTYVPTSGHCKFEKAAPKEYMSLNNKRVEEQER
jgi:hypothetical protein